MSELKDISLWIKKHSPQILTGLGVACGIASNILAIKGTIDAVKKYESIKDNNPSKKEIVKNCWKYYIPTAIATAASGACAIGACIEQNNRTEAAVSMYQAAASTLATKTGEEVKKLVTGKDVIKEIESDDEKSKKIKELSSSLSDDQVLCIDLSFGQEPFASSKNDILAAMNRINKMANEDGDQYTLNDFNDCLDRPTFRGGNYIIVADDTMHMDVMWEPVIIHDIPCIGFTYDFKPAKSL